MFIPDPKTATKEGETIGCPTFFWLQKRGKTTYIFFHSPLFVVVGSGIRNISGHMSDVRTQVPGAVEKDRIAKEPPSTPPPPPVCGRPQT
jgi:hypothetical protein